jgi:hypothetical protein
MQADYEGSEAVRDRGKVIFYMGGLVLLGLLKFM